MNPYREMVLIPMEELNRLRHSIKTPNATSAMQKELFEMKQSFGDAIPDDRRFKLESEIISKHATSAEIPNSSPPPETEAVISMPQNDLIVQHLAGFTNYNRVRAMRLFQHLNDFYKRNNTAKWNDLGQLYDVDKKLIPGSNLIELIDTVTNSLGSNPSYFPVGFDVFIDMLHDSNMPQTVYSAKGRAKMLEYKQHEPMPGLDKSLVDDSWETLEYS